MWHTTIFGLVCTAPNCRAATLPILTVLGIEREGRLATQDKYKCLAGVLRYAARCMHHTMRFCGVLGQQHYASTWPTLYHAPWTYETGLESRRTLLSS